MAPADGVQPGDDGIEYDLCEATSTDRPRCAFCLQPVEAALARTCGRCRTLYHPDCWTANNARCAVYGCDPVLPPPPRRRRIVFRRPVASRLGGGRSEFPFPLVLFIILVAGMFALRFRAVHHVHSRDVEGSDHWEHEPPPPDDLGDAEALAGQAQRFLVDLDKRGGVPKDAESRRALRGEADEAADKLRRALDLSVLHLRGHRELMDRLRTWTTDLDRLQRLREELSE